jgi:PIN domain nuclease of toxin-antitoxin system
LTTNRDLLLDTHAALWLADGSLLSNVLDRVIEQGAFLSPITAWEIGLLANGEKPKLDFSALGGAQKWYSMLLSGKLVRECVLTGEIALEATNLPGAFHRDPADRFLVATARRLDLCLVTRDAKIIDYAEAGHVEVLAC